MTSECNHFQKEWLKTRLLEGMRQFLNSVPKDSVPFLEDDLIRELVS